MAICEGESVFPELKTYPFFSEQKLHSIQNVQLLHGYHLFWPELDVDLEMDNLENPEKYPLQYKTGSELKGKSGHRAVACR